MSNVADHNSSRLAINVLDKVGIVIPTYNAAVHWEKLTHYLSAQEIVSSQVVIVDSSSTDETSRLAKTAGYKVVSIHKEDFSHGATRQLACGYLPNSDFLVFMTQDAILVGPNSIERLCMAFDDPTVGAVYGRQLPRINADPIERHGRLFNYPPISETRDFESRHELGFKTAFFSNSFSAYRRSALEAVGGFPCDAIVSEEVTVVARMLLAGWRVRYEAKAQVFHSHRLNLAKEFARYFDIGVHHGQVPWLLEAFGSTGTNGLRFIKSELKCLTINAPLWIPYAAVRTISKYVAYRLGRYSKHLPHLLCKKISAHPHFWEKRKSTYVSSARHHHVRHLQQAKSSRSPIGPMRKGFTLKLKEKGKPVSGSNLSVFGWALVASQSAGRASDIKRVAVADVRSWTKFRGSERKQRFIFAHLPFKTFDDVQALLLSQVPARDNQHHMATAMVGHYWGVITRLCRKSLRRMADWDAAAPWTEGLARLFDAAQEELLY